MKEYRGIEAVRDWRDGLAAEAAERGEPMFLGKPDAWFEDIHWFCAKGHVRHMYSRCRKSGGDACVACGQAVLMGPAITEEEFRLLLSRF